MTQEQNPPPSDGSATMRTALAEAYECLFDQTADGIAIVGARGEIQRANPAACRLFGYKPDELTQRPLAGILRLSTADPASFSAWAGRLRGASCIQEARRKDGSAFEVELSVRALPDGSWQCVMRKSSGTAASGLHLEGETLLQVAGRSARFGGWLVNLPAQRVIWSDEVAAIHEMPPGHSPSVAEGIEFYAPDSRERIRQVFEACIRDGTPFDEELEIITARGRHVWVRSLGVGVRDAGGAIVRVQGAFQDISDRKRAESALRRSEARYRALIEHAPLAIFVNRDDRVVLANAACLHLFGAARPEDMVGKSPYALFDPRDHAAIRERIVQMREHNRPAPAVEERIIRMDGTAIDVEVSAALFEDDGTRAIHVILRDITERKRAEDAIRRAHAQLEHSERTLRRLNARLTEAQSAAGIGSWEWDVITDSVWWSEELYHIFEVTPEDHVPSVVSNAQFVHPDDCTAYHSDVRRVLETGGVLDHDLRIVTRSGRLKYCNTRATVERDASGRPVRVSGTFMDVTERKLADLERMRGSEMLSKLARQVPGAMYQIRRYADGRLCFPYASPGLREIFECDPAEVRTDAALVMDRVHPEDHERVAEAILASAQTLQPFHCEFRVLLPRQGLRWRLSNAQPEHAEDGSVLWYGMISDITGLKEAEAALRSSVAEKEALLREVHHRVKNNLQVITSLLRLQEARIDAPGSRAVLQDMQARIRSMALLHETLHRSANLARVDLGAYLESVCNQLARAVGRHDLQGKVEFECRFPSVHITPDQAAPCGLILNELMSNALHHAFPAGRTGRIRVALDTDRENAAVTIRVSDNGVGLPADFGAKRECSLGLQLVADLTKQLEGSLEISQGRETVFSVRFVPREGV